MEQVAAATGQSIVNDLQNLAGIPNNPPKLTMGWCVECHRTVNAKGIAAVHQVADLPKASVVVPPPSGRGIEHGWSPFHPWPHPGRLEKRTFHLLSGVDRSCARYTRRP
jgi:hypothetical protein